MQIKVFAPAKINLALHVTGQREDGYHLLDTLVAFAPVGDELYLQNAGVTSLRVTGPEAQNIPDGPDNLVLRAAACMPGPVAAELRKVLPVASGIGGGSADAAAVLRGLSVLHMAAIPEDAEALGADVPMCITPHPARVRGIGERIEVVNLPSLPAVLVNPRVQVPTPAVFRALTQRNQPPMSDVPVFSEAAACIDWLREQRNDLQAAAITIAPVIADVLGALAGTEGCRLARMSGSGATCFGLFDTDEAARKGADILKKLYPKWWVADGALGDQTRASIPRII